MRTSVMIQAHQQKSMAETTNPVMSQASCRDFADLGRFHRQLQ